MPRATGKCILGAHPGTPMCLGLVVATGIDDQEQMDGRNAWDLVAGKAGRLHERVVTQYEKFAAVHDRRWHYFQHVSGNLRGAGPCLYDLPTDPGQTANVVQKHPQVAAELRSHLADRLRQKLPEVASTTGP